MSAHQLHDLTTALEALHRNALIHRQQQRRAAAGKKPHAPQLGRPPRLAFADRLLATIIHLRLQLPDAALAPIFTSNRSTIRRAIAEIRQLLDQHGTTIEPITPSAPVTDLLTPTNQPKIKPAS